MANDLVIPVGYAQCSMVFYRDGDLEEMDCTFGVATSDLENTASDVALAVGHVFSSTGLPNGVHLVRVKCLVAQEGDVPQSQEATAIANGSGTAKLLPQNCAMLWKKITGHGGRRGRGRMYLPFVREDDCDDVGNLSSTTITAQQTTADLFLAELADTAHGAATPMVLLHHQGESLVPLPYPVTGLVVDPRIGSQRQRLRR